jgi:hypothetical protein
MTDGSRAGFDISQQLRSIFLAFNPEFPDPGFYGKVNPSSARMGKAGTIKSRPIFLFLAQLIHPKIFSRSYPRSNRFSANSP